MGQVGLIYSVDVFGIKYTDYRCKVEIVTV